MLAKSSSRVSFAPKASAPARVVVVKSSGKAQVNVSAPLMLGLCISSLVLAPMAWSSDAMPIGGGESKPAEGSYDKEAVKKILCASNFQSEACLKDSFKKAPELKE